MWKNFRVHPFPSEQLYRDLCQYLYKDQQRHLAVADHVAAIRSGRRPEESPPSQVETTPVIRLLAHEALAQCKTVIFEDDYIDRDFFSEFSSFYSRCFKSYPSRCLRLHFLNVEMPSEADVSSSPKESYLGFAVLRPTESNSLGRTIILPPSTNQGVNFITCTASFSATILGEEFKVQGMPFIQQDTQVGSCAHAALWMLARYMAKHFHFRDFLPGEINSLAKAHIQLGREYPSDKDGLTVAQMLDALRGMGFEPTHYEKSALKSSTDGSAGRDFMDCPASLVDEEAEDRIYTKRLAEIAYRYIESKLPVIFNLKDHAIVAIGHSYEWNVLQPSIATIDRIPSFFVHDDGVAPYIELPILAKNPLTGVGFSDVKSIIAVTPKSASLSAEDAEARARIAIQQFRNVVEAVTDAHNSQFPENNRLEFRTYLLPSIHFQQLLRRQSSSGVFHQEAARRLIQVDYPRFVWITEVTTSDLLRDPDKLRRQCLGRVIMDSTASKKANSIIAIHFQDVLVVKDRQGKDPDFSAHYSRSTPVSQWFSAD